MKIPTVSQIREADSYTIQHEPVSSDALMERAATACTDWIRERYRTSVPFHVVCGTGNNGGDGLAIARLLAASGYSVSVSLVNSSSRRSAGFTSNYERLKAPAPAVPAVEIHSAEAFREALPAGKNSVVIDALFGSGLNRPAEGLPAEVIREINAANSEVISVDIPSGLFGDTLNGSGDAVICATYTLSFQFPKLSFMLPESTGFAGEVEILDIGLHTDYTGRMHTGHYFVTDADAASLLKKRKKNAHKGNFGHSLIVAGSYGKMGAAVIAAKACLKSGTGLLTAYIPKCGYGIMQTALPEAMTDTGQGTDFITDLPSPGRYNAIGIGPGIGNDRQTQNAFKQLIGDTAIPLVIDADAINIIAENKDWMAAVPAGSIFTPHPKEFERLAGKPANSLERLQMLREFCINNKVYVVLKGVHTATGCPDGSIYFNSTGNPGMAKGGSGDALTGVITALIAQHYIPEQACILGVYLHGLAGNFAARATSAESMLASDLIDCIGDAYNFMIGINERK